MTGRHQFTIGPGIYQYRFTLKVPLNNTCHVDKTWSMPGTSPRTHYKSLLPPSLDITTGGLDSPAEVKIQYYVKATITRPSLVRSNIRAVGWLPSWSCMLSSRRPDSSNRVQSTLDGMSPAELGARGLCKTKARLPSKRPVPRS